MPVYEVLVTKYFFQSITLTVNAKDRDHLAENKEAISDAADSLDAWEMADTEFADENIYFEDEVEDLQSEEASVNLIEEEEPKKQRRLF